MPPKFLVDRNLGTRIVPEGLRGAGWNVRTLADIYGGTKGQQVRDEEWLEFAGRQEFRVLMLDKRIRYRAIELDALVRHKVVAFCLTSGSLDGATQAQRFLDSETAILRIASLPGPSLHMISKASMGRVNLH